MAAILISVENINFWKICLAIGEESIYGVRVGALRYTSLRCFHHPARQTAQGYFAFGDAKIDQILCFMNSGAMPELVFQHNGAIRDIFNPYLFASIMKGKALP